MEKSDHQNRLSIIQAWALWIKKVVERQHRGGIWYASDLTLMFNHIPGSFQQKWEVMADEADRFYSTLSNHVIHNKRSPSQAAKLPTWIVAPDYPVKKQDGMSAKAILAEVKINEGLHLNGADRYAPSRHPEHALRPKWRQLSALCKRGISTEANSRSAS
jgi:hypothetical protein